jgi:hypothetical protein
MALWNQRVRWARGNLGVTLKHRNKIGKARYHKAATVGYPFWVSNIIAPASFLFVSLGLILGSILNVNEVLVSTLGRFLAFSFFFILVAGVIVNRGKSWFGGFMAPGVPLLILLFANIINSQGIVGVIDSLGYTSYSDLVGLLFISMLLFSMLGTLLCLKISKKHVTTANFLQLALFGYWALLVSSVLYGYYKELRREDMVWIRTER